MSTTSMAIFSNPLFATYSVYAHNASIVLLIFFWFALLLTVNKYMRAVTCIKGWGVSSMMSFHLGIRVLLLNVAGRT